MIFLAIVYFFELEIDVDFKANYSVDSEPIWSGAAPESPHFSECPDELYMQFHNHQRHNQLCSML